MSDAPTGEHDPLTTKVYDVLDQVIETQQAMRMLAEAIRDNRGGQTQTIIHKTAGVGPWMAFAIGVGITICFCTIVGLIVLYMDLHDLRAWQDIMRQKIAKLEAKP